MAKRIPADFHMHTHHSGDSEAPMEMMIEKAIERKVPEICITEHMDFDYPVNEHDTAGIFEVNTDEYMAETVILKEKYKDRITVNFGIELGLQPHLVERNSEYAKSYPYRSNIHKHSS